MMHFYRPHIAGRSQLLCLYFFVNSYTRVAHQLPHQPNKWLDLPWAFSQPVTAPSGHLGDLSQQLTTLFQKESCVHVMVLSDCASIPGLSKRILLTLSSSITDTIISAACSICHGRYDGTQQSVALLVSLYSRHQHSDTNVALPTISSGLCLGAPFSLSYLAVKRSWLYTLWSSVPGFTRWISWIFGSFG